VDLASGHSGVLTFGPQTDRLPKWSPDGRQIAFLSDRHAAGDFQLHFLDPASGAALAGARVSGWVEYFHWSPDGARLLLGVAGHGGGCGGRAGSDHESTIPAGDAALDAQIETGNEDFRWRDLCL